MSLTIYAAWGELQKIVSAKQAKVVPWLQARQPSSCIIYVINIKSPNFCSYISEKDHFAPEVAGWLAFPADPRRAAHAESEGKGAIEDYPAVVNARRWVFHVEGTHVS